MFTGLVFTGSRLVWDFFSELTPKWGPQLSTIFTLSWLMSMLFLCHHVSEPTILSIRVVPLLPHGWGESNISISTSSTPALKIWDLRHFLVISGYRSISPGTNWPTMSVLADVSQRSDGYSRRLSVCFLFLFFLFSLLPQKFSW